VLEPSHPAAAGGRGSRSRAPRILSVVRERAGGGRGDNHNSSAGDAPPIDLEGPGDARLRGRWPWLLRRSVCRKACRGRCAGTRRSRGCWRCARMAPGPSPRRVGRLGAPQAAAVGDFRRRWAGSSAAARLSSQQPEQPSQFAGCPCGLRSWRRVRVRWIGTLSLPDFAQL
jgi:hypothetical protein